MKSKKTYLLAAILVTFIIFFSIVWLSSRSEKSPEQRPKIVQPDNPENDKDFKWYVRFAVKEQKTTAYTEEVNAPKPADGKSYFPGGIAVHPRYPINSGGKPRQPLLPFGTVIHLTDPISVQGQKFSSFTVIDTGDVYYGLWPDYPYWFDVYFGTGNYYNNKDARDYGVPLKDYYWYEEWK